MFSRLIYAACLLARVCVVCCGCRIGSGRGRKTPHPTCAYLRGFPIVIMACCGSRPAAEKSAARGKSGAAPAAKSGGNKKIMRMDSQTSFMIHEHGWAFKRIAELCIPSVARANGARNHPLPSRLEPVHLLGWSIPRTLPSRTALHA